ncbi:MAG: TlyA family rRNA (cytidine-2'-O)-methyltransferase [Planctomycetota bacterium]|nr:TlyA family rRNA (cytidine-2'-O)-methyltransferase [Planctomycetota bacterium]
MTTQAQDKKYVSRAGLKLEHALREFKVDVTGLICADFGCHVGGFTDCLLQHGAAKVYAIDTGYGVLDYRLRTDPRVAVMERTNVLHAEPPAAKAELVVIDLGWTRQRHAIPAALRWLGPGGRIISLIKPHYELAGDEKASLLVDGVLAPQHAEAVVQRVLGEFGGLGAAVTAMTLSPIRGAKSGRRAGSEGNREYLVGAAKPRGDRPPVEADTLPIDASPDAKI